MEAERRYALDALLDALGLPFDEAAPARPDELDEVFSLRRGRASPSCRLRSGSGSVWAGTAIPAARGS